jgi:hypothetical protein
VIILYLLALLGVLVAQILILALLVLVTIFAVLLAITTVWMVKILIHHNKISESDWFGFEIFLTSIWPQIFTTAIIIDIIMVIIELKTHYLM